MHQMPFDKEVDDGKQLFQPTSVKLIDEKQWLYLKRLYHMTPRELQIARLVCKGFNNDEIANNLNIRHGTAKTHLRNIYRRVHVNSRINLLLRFVEDANNLQISGKVS